MNIMQLYFHVDKYIAWLTLPGRQDPRFFRVCSYLLTDFQKFLFYGGTQV